jgi:hypothetical protein
LGHVVTRKNKELETLAIKLEQEQDKLLNASKQVS